MQGESEVHKSTIILGRPFLMTANTKIVVHKAAISMEFGEDIVQ